MAPIRVAIVGSGCSGIGALWALKDSGYDVHLYEADATLGGHTNTVQYEHNGKKVMVDTGFIVFNMATYPNLIRFLKEVDVKTVPTLMTFGVSRDNGAFEWAGTSLGSIFAQSKHIISPRFWRMVYDVLRFNQYALDVLRDEDESEVDPAGTNGVEDSSSQPSRQESIGEFLERGRYSDAFIDDYLIPMTAAVWSTSPEKCSLQFPAITLIRFMWNHHLLSSIAERPDWMTIPGGSQQYIDAVMKDFPAKNVHLNTQVIGVEDINDKVIVQLEDSEELFDHVILAVHGDQALEIIRDGATQEEIKIMEGFKTSPNEAYLHSDLSLMPQRRTVWSSWNYMTKSTDKSANVDQVSLTYNMNILQHIPDAVYGDVLVTLNPLHEPDPKKTQGHWKYSHPLYTPEAIRSQKRLPRIQNTRGISYAGAWTKYGFHEDGFSSGLKVAIEHLGAKIPFDFIDSTFSRGRKPTLNLGDYIWRIFLFFFGTFLWIVDLYVWILLVPFGYGSSQKRVKKE